MTTQAIDALHAIHTATNDVLKGYREMAARAQPDIAPVIQRLTQMHAQHAAAQAAELSRLRQAQGDDTSLQGTVNKLVVMVRDWLSDLDRGVLPAVRAGEESLRDDYTAALGDSRVAGHATVATLLQTQLAAINAAIAALPQD